ncbi:ndufs4 NADH dehydrogenase Fe-S protein subunit [Friedmanniomyces endolithicus]|uniref:NADH dehydrogenase [ubiquinone] iron-sulfur protein 4, mitochondrial n=1 Tax=Friedmanniomyces endolithicus TaxID=329885 RepID=A0AAN6KV66_9PEZI|nr:ndufs4 NADH dehydrogenase Fe-S protein subunit [Friedmanniomyces endolithicus]KAK0800460.1 ndufs4 NADH dehydrogenase Fe-S protein subunit [Friedmanniomyces endolithicus]KAK0807204.1 ndufs4 NADH dehydrogenase Fe-S protein subunit [Friedmanniomyces endolithicus]KAK0848959.1 ndufs4 NADH dehydrogenase Fe-S protein subunit [Friedmanniomyces endolithicus]KAK0880122.1 ndufs4 NADH dehydrogenase Fe-S protein subunit [Friedmanniomyces endolithicus]
MGPTYQAAANTLRTAARPTLSLRAPFIARVQAARCISEEAPRKVSPDDPPSGEGGRMSPQNLTRTEEGASGGQPKHQPDYNVAADYRTSNFSPVPTRVMDGSEPGLDTPAAVLSGAPMDLQARTVRIYRPAKTPTQSGTWHGHHWRMDWDVLSKGHRWENPLMGWQSSADFMQGTHLNFNNKEDAINFATKQGYEYFVQEPNERKMLPKAYATQFVYQAKKLKEVRTK